MDHLLLEILTAGSLRCTNYESEPLSNYERNVRPEWLVTSKKVMDPPRLASSFEKSADRGPSRRPMLETRQHSHSLVEEATRRTHGFPALMHLPESERAWGLS